MVTAPWPAPPKIGTLGTVHLIGDLQTEWENVWPDPNDNTVFDAIGRDIQDNLVHSVPDLRIQMGDISDGSANMDRAVLEQRFNLFDQWCGRYGLDMWKVCGNHDIPEMPGDAPLPPDEWAAFWGYPHHSYAINLPYARILVLTATGNQHLMIPAPVGPTSCKPMTADDLAWLDARLSEDTRPTIIACHPPLYGEPTMDPDGAWNRVQSTLSGGAQAPELRALLNDHTHVIGWMHGHTHDAWGPEGRGVNSSLLNVGSRNIVVVDASATYIWPNGEYKRPITFYTSLLDDGKTVEVRWRQHDAQMWNAPAGMPFVQRLTAT
jgi:hypothetical protein